MPNGTVSLPIVMAEEFPFVEASIEGAKGKLMLDTGIEPAPTINDHRVPVVGGRTIGVGHFGSGQTFDIKLVPSIADIRIGALHFTRATTVPAQDARMLEEITPDFIGWFGFHAWADHAMKLDYRSGKATFYAEGKTVYLKGERLEAALPFETRKLPNQPVMPGLIGTTPVALAWDTGQYGTLYTGDATKAALIAKGVLSPSRSKPGAFDLHGLAVAGHKLPDLTGIDVESHPFAAAEPIGLTEPDILTIGFSLLRQYKTVWDFRSKTIYLLAR